MTKGQEDRLKTRRWCLDTSCLHMTRESSLCAEQRCTCCYSAATRKFWTCNREGKTCRRRPELGKTTLLVAFECTIGNPIANHQRKGQFWATCSTKIYSFVSFCVRGKKSVYILTCTSRVQLLKTPEAATNACSSATGREARVGSSRKPQAALHEHEAYDARVQMRHYRKGHGGKSTEPLK